MKTEMKSKDVFNTTNIVVDLGQSVEAQNLLSGFSPDYYNAGYLGHNFDIYDINGIRFLLGGRTPDPWQYKRTTYSTEILKKCSKEMYSLDSTARDYQEKKLRIMEVFCNSIERGIHDPKPVTSWPNFKRQLAEQKAMFPNKTLTLIGKELLEEVPSGKNSGEIKERICDGIQKVIDAHPELGVPGQPERKMEGALRIIHDEQAKKNERDHRLTKEPGRER